MNETTQQATGKNTEEIVANELGELGLVAFKPVPDRGIDLVAHFPGDPENLINIQIKGRGAVQKNKRYRWFQLRTTKAQRERALKAGLGAENAWKNKVEKCDFFVLVSKKHEEKWVFNKKEIYEIISYNKQVYGNRTDNKEGKQVEMDLDIEVNGRPLTSLFEKNCNNFDPIVEALRAQRSS